MKEITFLANNVGSRLDVALIEFFPEYSRKILKDLIMDSNILLNNKAVKSNYKIVAGDKASYDPEVVNNFAFTKDTGIKIIPKNQKLKILYEDEHTLIVDKPTGLDSHPASKNNHDSVLNGLYFHLSRQQKYDKNAKIRLVHRLDQGTSGILLASKSAPAHYFYSKQFEDRQIQKIYYAIVKGDFLEYLEKKHKNNRIEISNHISTEKNNFGRYFISEASKNTRLAKTIVKFESHFNKFGKKKFSLLKIQILTGRSHQIRVHLSNIKFPILGDTLYGGQKYKRVMLHASELEFIPFGKEKYFRIESPLPDKFLEPTNELES